MKLVTAIINQIDDCNTYFRMPSIMNLNQLRIQIRKISLNIKTWHQVIDIYGACSSGSVEYNVSQQQTGSTVRVAKPKLYKGKPLEKSNWKASKTSELIGPEKSMLVLQGLPNQHRVWSLCQAKQIVISVLKINYNQHSTNNGPKWRTVTYFIKTRHSSFCL